MFGRQPEFVAVPLSAGIGVENRALLFEALEVEITFVEVDSVGGIFGERECYDTRMQFRGVVALLDTGDIGRLPCGIVAGFPPLRRDIPLRLVLIGACSTT